MEYSETRVLKFARAAYGIAKRSSIRPYSSKFSKKTFTQYQHIAILCLKHKKKLKYRELEVHVTASRKHDTQIAIPLVKQYEKELGECCS